MTSSFASIIITTAARWLRHLKVSTCCFGAFAETADADNLQTIYVLREMAPLVVHSHSRDFGHTLMCGGAGAGSQAISISLSPSLDLHFTWSIPLCGFVINPGSPLWLKINLYSDFMVKCTHVEVHDLSVLQLNKTH